MTNDVVPLARWRIGAKCGMTNKGSVVKVLGYWVMGIWSVHWMKLLCPLADE